MALLQVKSQHEDVLFARFANSIDIAAYHHSVIPDKESHHSHVNALYSKKLQRHTTNLHFNDRTRSLPIKGFNKSNTKNQMISIAADARVAIANKPTRKRKN